MAEGTIKISTDLDCGKILLATPSQIYHETSKQKKWSIKTIKDVEFGKEMNMQVFKRADKLVVVVKESLQT